MGWSYLGGALTLCRRVTKIDMTSLSSQGVGGYWLVNASVGLTRPNYQVLTSVALLDLYKSCQRRRWDDNEFIEKEKSQTHGQRKNTTHSISVFQTPPTRVLKQEGMKWYFWVVEEIAQLQLPLQWGGGRFCYFQSLITNLLLLFKFLQLLCDHF